MVSGHIGSSMLAKFKLEFLPKTAIELGQKILLILFFKQISSMLKNPALFKSHVLAGLISPFAESIAAKLYT